MEQLVRMFTLLSPVLCLLCVTDNDDDDDMIRVHSFNFPYSHFFVLYVPSHSEYLRSVVTLTL